MNEQTVRAIMSGETRGVGASVMRATLGLLEMPYRSAMSMRNVLFTRGLKRVHRLDRPVISVGNITTGGTGKTPVVQWLARELIAMNKTPAILMRGYAKAAGAASSDEEQLLRESLKCDVYADPDRVAAGRRALAANPDIDVFVLDDGFQHRRLHRDLDLVLIDATNPFGYGHVLPRGMLREPIDGIARASAVIVTRVDLATDGELNAIEARVREIARDVPIYHARQQLIDAARFEGERVFAFSGIGNPAAFEASLTAAGVELVGALRFGDHHVYAARDAEQIARAAQTAGATRIVTTEKDWTKFEKVSREPSEVTAFSKGVETIGLCVGLSDSDRAKLLGQVTAAMASTK